jgi:hypothetical protein
MMTDFEKFKPIIKELIKFYYDQPGNGAGGGILHIILDDGNTDHAFIDAAKWEAYDAKDYTAALICEVLMCFSEEEIDAMFEDGHWGMR